MKKGSLVISQGCPFSWSGSVLIRLCIVICKGPAAFTALSAYLFYCQFTAEGLFQCGFRNNDRNRIDREIGY